MDGDTSRLTGLLDGSRTLSKHAQGSVDQLSVEPPGGAVVSKSNVFTVSAQDVCGHLHHTHDSTKERGEELLLEQTEQS